MADSPLTNSRGLSAQAFWQNFMGDCPLWYKRAIIAFLAINPFLLLLPAGTTIAGWVLVGEFIFTLAMALRCYPLLPGGLLAFEAFLIQLAPADAIYEEIEHGLPVILLLMFMVAGIYFMKELLLFIFTKILLGVRSQILLALLFSVTAAFLSAFLDALTVTAVVITVAGGFYRVYQEVWASAHISSEDGTQELEQFRSFLRGLLMHAAVGTALGGVMTTVGEPQNLLIADRLDWNFVEFFMRMAYVTMPVFVVGVTTCVLLELTRKFGYGTRLPTGVKAILVEFDLSQQAKRNAREKARLIVQAISGVFLVFALAYQLAAVGVIGLSIIVLQTAFNGVTSEHDIGPAFQEALPFTALLTVFFAIVAVINHQELFTPVLELVLSMDPEVQPGVFYIANGVLSAISDNVFVATVYIHEVHSAYQAGEISRELFDKLGVAINTGTNIPSILTPNGQAAFLFLLTSSVAPKIDLSYGRMVLMAIPYFITMGITGWAAVHWIL